MQKTFSVKEALTFGWDTFRSRVPFFIALTLVPIVSAWLFQGLSSVFTSLAENFSDPGSSFSNLGVFFSVGSFAVSIVSTVISILLSIGITHVQLETIDGEKPAFLEIFSRKDLLGKGFLTMLVAGILTMLGFVALIIPGIIASILYQFYMFVLVDNSLFGFAALQESARVTKGVRMKLILFSLVMMGVNMLGFLALGVGCLITLPVTTLAHAYIYRTLQQQTDVK